VTALHVASVMSESCCAMGCWCVSCTGRSLRLHNNELIGSIPSTLGNLTSLR
jgi:hypothetical protein